MTFPVSRQPIIVESEWKLSSTECRSWALNHVTFPSSVTPLLLYLIRYAFIDFSLISALPNCVFLKNECHLWTPQCLITGLKFLCLVALSCLTLWPHRLPSLPGSSVHGDSPGKNTGVGCHGPQTQGLNLGLLHCRQILNQLSHQGSHLFGACDLFFRLLAIWSKMAWNHLTKPKRMSRWNLIPQTEKPWEDL